MHPGVRVLQLFAMNWTAHLCTCSSWLIIFLLGKPSENNIFLSFRRGPLREQPRRVPAHLSEHGGRLPVRMPRGLHAPRERPRLQER